MPNVFVPDFNEFVQLHGQEYYEAKDGTRDYVFRDGARWSSIGLGYKDPPPGSKAKHEREFVKLKLSHRKEDYQRLRDDVERSASFAAQGMRTVAPPTERDFEELEKLNAKVAETERELSQLDKPEKSEHEAELDGAEKAWDERRANGRKMLNRLGELPNYGRVL